VSPGERVLDVGTGTGVVARAAQEAAGDGVVVGVDQSVPMLEAGTRSVRLAAASAIDLPFREATFDAVLAGFVLSHFPRLDTALFDVIRVLKPGGRLGATTWGETEDEFQLAWRELVEQVVPHEVLQDAVERAMPNEERLRDARRLEGTLRDAGLHPVTVERQEYRFVMRLDDYVDGRTTAASGRFVRDMLGDRDWPAFLERARAVFRERFPDPLTDFREVLIAVATKPADYQAGDVQGR